MCKYSFASTPMSHPAPSALGEKESLTNTAVVLPKLTFLDVSSEIQALSENKRNMLTADEILVLYLRDCSQMVNSSYYGKVV